MPGDPRMSDREMAAINAAAVTKEYRVQPHLGELLLAVLPIHFCLISLYRLSHRLCYQRVGGAATFRQSLYTHVPCRPLVVLDNVKVSGVGGGFIGKCH